MKRWSVLALIAAAILGACGDEPADGGDAAGECDTSVVEHDSGLKVQDKECGSGPEAKSGDLVVVHYTGKLEEGTEFDSSEGGEPFPLQLGSGMVIQGWEQGLVGMKKGGTRTLTIPPELGYGADGYPPDIPPNATLIFDVELVDLQPAEG